MAEEPDNMVLALLREMRQEAADFRHEVYSRFDRVEARLEALEKKVENIRRAHAADSLLGPYARSPKPRSGWKTSIGALTL